jgi:hypothetical protein
MWPPPPEEDEPLELPLALPPPEETLPPELAPPEAPTLPPPELAATLLLPIRTGRPAKLELMLSSGQEIWFDRLR